MNIPDNLEDILNKLIINGASPMIVGGYIRDHFLQITSKDIDIEVYALQKLEDLESLLSEFGDVNLVGKSFGVVKLKIKDEEYDFSFPRSENKIALGHRGFEVNIDGQMSYKDGAKRRDFTINSIAYDFKNKIFLDPYGGIEDLKNKKLKHINEKTFIEDPLRVYRAIQFCARFDLKIDTNTYALFEVMVKKEEFKSLAKERIFEEYKKLFLKSKKPSLGIELLSKLKIQNINQEILEKIDNIVKIKTGDEKIDLVFFYFYLEDILKEISKDVKLLRDIENLKNFKVPKIYEYKIENIKDEQEILKEKYFMMKNMPKVLFMGKDLIALGLKPSKEFKNILDRVYEKQLAGQIKTFDEAKEFIKEEFNL